MRKIVLSFLFASIILNVGARSVNLDNERFTLRYRWYPKVESDSTFVTYSAEIKKPASIAMFAENIDPTQIKIEGLKYVQTGGDFKITLNLENLIITNATVTSRTEESKDKDGKVTSRTTYYKAVISYTFGAAVNVTDRLGQKRHEAVLLSQQNAQQWESPEYSTYKGAADAFNNNKEAIKSEITTKSVSDALSLSNANLKYALGYPSFEERILFQSLGSKKDEEYSAFNAALKTLQGIVENIKPKSMPANIEATAQPAIEFFTALINKYNDPQEKFQKQYRYGALMNLAQFYYCTEQYEKAKLYAEKIISNDYDPKDGKKIIEKTDEILRFYAKRHVSTCHFITQGEK